MKTILIDDYYAPGFRVPLNTASCAAAANPRRISLTPLFRATHAACPPEAIPAVRRRSRFASPQPA